MTNNNSYIVRSLINKGFDISEAKILEPKIEEVVMKAQIAGIGDILDAVLKAIDDIK